MSCASESFGIKIKINKSFKGGHDPLAESSESLFSSVIIYSK